MFEYDYLIPNGIPLQTKKYTERIKHIEIISMFYTDQLSGNLSQNFWLISNYPFILLTRVTTSVLPPIGYLNTSRENQKATNILWIEKKEATREELESNYFFFSIENTTDR